MLTSVGEYLSTCYRPDRDYVDGEVRERNWGEWDHGRLQVLLAGYFLKCEKISGLLAVTEQRVQVKPTRFRIPDVALVRGTPGEQILTRSPFLCVEILSPQDSLSQIGDRIDDYLVFGVENIWIVNPEKKAYWVDAAGTHEGADSVLEVRDPWVKVDFKEFWPA